MMLGTSTEQQAKPDMNNQTQNRGWQRLPWPLAARDNPIHCPETQKAASTNQQNTLVFSGRFSEASSFHSDITKVLTKLLSWEMKLFCPILQVASIFITIIRKLFIFSGQMLYKMC